MTDAKQIADAWTAFWNGTTDPALLTDDFTIHFGGDDEYALAGDPIRGGAEFADYITRFRAARDVLFSVQADPIAEGDRLALLWGVSGGDVYRSGIDILRVEGDRIAEVWSVTGKRRM